MFTKFEYITFFSCPNRRNIFNRRFISKKHLWLEVIDKIGCSKSVRPSTVIYIIYIYITRTDFEHNFNQLFRVRVVLSRWTFHEKCFFCWDTKKMLYIQNWWTIPLSTAINCWTVVNMSSWIVPLWIHPYMCVQWGFCIIKAYDCNEHYCVPRSEQLIIVSCFQVREVVNLNTKWSKFVIWLSIWL